MKTLILALTLAVSTAACTTNNPIAGGGPHSFAGAGGPGDGGVSAVAGMGGGSGAVSGGGVHSPAGAGSPNITTQN